MTSKNSIVDRSDDHGPFDIIGDVHGCARELHELLAKLGYAAHDAKAPLNFAHPLGRRVIFLGDLVDRGPDIVAVLQTVMSMVRNGNALCVKGNHDFSLALQLHRHGTLLGRELLSTVSQLQEYDRNHYTTEAEREQFYGDLAGFIDDLPHHYVLDDGKLVVAHAGLTAEFQGLDSDASREFALYGVKAPGDDYTDRLIPSRAAWVLDYTGAASVVYGHTPVDAPRWINNTLCVDTGCVYGGALSALRYPERDVVSVQAHSQYYGNGDKIWRKPADE